MNDDLLIINRFGEPSKQDIAPYGSICIVKNNSQTKIFLYIQLSHDESNPVWTLICECEENATQEEIIEKQKVFMCSGTCP